MGFGVGIIELVILIVVVVGIISFIGLRNRSASRTESIAVRQPRLSQCPGCSAKLDETCEECPQCGLRVGI